MRLFTFLLRVLVFSAIAFPVAAQELRAPAAPLQLVVPPSPTLTEQAPLSVAAPAAAAPFVGDAACPNYWIVSSRCSIQNIHEACHGPWRLDVYQRTPDRQLRPTNLASLSSQLIPGIPVLVFSHGSFVEWNSQCQQAHELYVRLRQSCSAPLQVIFFTWPSEAHSQLTMPFEVNIRGRQADFNGFYVTSLITQIPPDCPVCLMGHSHGARVILSAMHLAGGGAIEGHLCPCALGSRRFRVVLAAAAMDHHWLNPGELFGCALNRVECLLNFRNRHDLPLALYPMSHIFARRALARSGITQRDAYEMGWNSVKIRQCDVTELVGHAHYWPYYYDQPGIVGAMVPYVYFQ